MILLACGSSFLVLLFLGLVWCGLCFGGFAPIWCGILWWCLFSEDLFGCAISWRLLRYVALVGLPMVVVCFGLVV